MKNVIPLEQIPGLSGSGLIPKLVDLASLDHGQELDDGVVTSKRVRAYIMQDPISVVDGDPREVARVTYTELLWDGNGRRSNQIIAGRNIVVRGGGRVLLSATSSAFKGSLDRYTIDTYQPGEWEEQASSQHWLWFSQDSGL